MIYLIDDECQFWLNETAGVLTSPHFDGIFQRYGHNLNCIWILKAEEGFYINLEMNFFRVRKDIISVIFTTFFKTMHHSRLKMVTIFQFMMEKIYSQARF